jgi:hypothetical protein
MLPSSRRLGPSISFPGWLAGKETQANLTKVQRCAPGLLAMEGGRSTAVIAVRSTTPELTRILGVHPDIRKSDVAKLPQSSSREGPESVCQFWTPLHPL